MQKGVNRVRTKNIHIMVTEYEHALIEERLKESGKNSMREYIVDMSINGYIINVDFKEMKNLTYESNKIGNNINQIAYRANSTDYVSQADIKEIKDKLELIWHMVRSKFYSFGGILKDGCFKD